MREYREKSAVEGLKKYMTRYRTQFLTSKAQAQAHPLETELLVVWTGIKSPTCLPHK
jgi:hypothetical protein